MTSPSALAHFPGLYQDLIGVIFPVTGGVPLDSETPMMTLSVLRISHPSLSEVLIGRCPSVARRLWWHRQLPSLSEVLIAIELCAYVCRGMWASPYYCVVQKKSNGLCLQCRHGWLLAWCSLSYPWPLTCFIFIYRGNEIRVAIFTWHLVPYMHISFI